MRDPNIYCGSGGNVPALPALLLLVGAEQSGVVSLLDHNEGDPWLVVRLQLDAGLSDSGEFVLEDVGELALTHPVPVHDDPMGLVAACALVEHHQVLPHHLRQVLDDVLSVLLNPHSGRISAGMSVLRANHGSNAR